MENRNQRSKPNWWIPGIVLGFIALLYIALLTALPKYAGRMPLFALLFIIDWLVFADLRAFRQKLPRFASLSFGIFWWTPVSLLLVFLVGSVVVSLTHWPDWLRIYLPGVAVIALVSKIALFVGLLPSYAFRLLALFPFGKQSFIPGFFRRAGIFFRNTGIALSVLVFALMILGSTWGVYRFRVTETEVGIRNLPPELEGLRIVQLSDIHLGSWVSAKPLARAVSLVQGLNPDLVVFTGDMVNYSTAEVQGFEEVLAGIRAPLGVYAILGNHDYGDYTSWRNQADKEKNLTDMEIFYKKIGWNLLRNQSVIILKDSAEFLLSGVENWSATNRFRKYGDMQKTLQGAEIQSLNILLSHDPTHWDAEVKTKYPWFDLTLSGHTHGMQMGIDFSGIHWSPAKFLYEEWGGLYSSQGRTPDEDGYLYVNAGLGHIGYPGRIGIRPEISLLILKNIQEY